MTILMDIDEQVNFGAIEAGKFFLVDSKAYLKLHPTPDGSNALQLRTMEYRTFQDYNQVLNVDGFIHIIKKDVELPEILERK